MRETGKHHLKAQRNRASQAQLLKLHNTFINAVKPTSSEEISGGTYIDHNKILSKYSPSCTLFPISRVEAAFLIVASR